MTETERAERKLALLEEKLAGLREQYREAQEDGARPRELRMLVERGQEIADRVEQGKRWIRERRAEGATV